MEIQTYKFDVDMWFASIDEYPRIEGMLEAGCVLQTRRALVWTNENPNPNELIDEQF